MLLRFFQRYEQLYRWKNAPYLTLNVILVYYFLYPLRLIVLLS